METISGNALIELMGYLMSGQFGMIDNWLLANWYGIVMTVLGLGFFAKYVTARKLIGQAASLADTWRRAKADSEYSNAELIDLGRGFAELADELEAKVLKGVFTNRSS